ncbi:MAG: peptidylprolyl isomerase [Myxococcales bacterium]|nr:peptidylprolyl isomerase [Myxococcales bacterium]
MKLSGSIVLAALLVTACDGGSSNPPTKDTAKTGAPATKPAATAPAAPAVTAKGPFPASTHEAMKAPDKATEEAPATFNVKFSTTVGDFSVACDRSWAPHGADRFYNLVKIGFFDDVAFFRAVKGFVVQFGIHGDPEVAKVWSNSNIEPDEVKESNKSGYLTFAQAGRPAGPGMTAAARSTQLFFNLKDNTNLDGMGFAPICKVTEGADVVTKIHTGYGERAGRDQGNIQHKGNPYLREKYPALDYIKTARLVEGGGGDEEKKDDEEGAEGAKKDDAAKADEAKAGDGEKADDAAK